MSPLRKPLATALLLFAAALPAVYAQASAQAPVNKPQDPPRETPPAPQPEREVRLPQVQEKTLANGLRVVVLENHEQPSVTLRVVVPAGKIYDVADKAGLAGATATLLTKGTQSRSAQQIAEAIDSVGGTLQSASGNDFGFAFTQVTSDQIDRGLELLADVVQKPSFPADEVERWRGQILNALQVQSQDPAYLAEAVFARAVFGGHSYGLPDAGTPASVGALTRDDLVAFHQKHYVPNGAIFGVVGDIKPADAFARVEKYFGGWKKGEDPKPPTLKATAGQRKILVIDKPDAVQTQVFVGQLGLAFRDPAFFPAQVYNSVLGGGVSARLYREIRRDRGLAYGAYSNFDTPLQPGEFQASTSTKTESTVEVLDLILKTMSKLAEEPVGAEELTGRKTYLSGTFVRQTEVPDNIVTILIQAMANGYGKDYIESYRDRIQAVTSADVQRFAKERIRPDQSLIVLVGNASGFADDLKKKFGAFETIPYDQVDLLRADLRQVKKEEGKPAS
jgi:zinc protease